MFTRLAIVIACGWSLFWVVLYILGADGLTPAELETFRASIGAMILVPWLIGLIVRYVRTGGIGGN